MEALITATFTTNPQSTFSTDQLVSVVYGRLNLVEKKHRVSVLRAARKVADRLWWSWGRSEGTGHPAIFYNRLDVHSFGVGHVRVHSDLDEAAAIERVTNPEAPWSRHGDVQPGGVFDLWVQFYRAHKDGKPEEAERIHGQIIDRATRRRALA